MTWSKAAAYAMLAVYEIARRSRAESGAPGVQAHEIARRYKLPLAYASKVMGQLARAGVLRSDRGPRGGFRLNRDADKISLWDVLEAVEEFTAPPRKSSHGFPPALQSLLQKSFKESEAQLRLTFGRFSMTDAVR